MNSKFRRVAVFVGAAALAGGAGIGVAAQGDSSPAGSPPALTQPAPGGQGGQRLSALAQALGVSESRLHAALEKARPSGAPGSAPGGPPSGSDMAETLASELGISVDKVRSAMEAVGPAGGGPPGGVAPGGAAPGGSSSGGSSSGGSSSGGSSSSGSVSGSLS
jgi:hypothetical protein